MPKFDVKGLKKEISRQVLRQLKKVGKAEERVRKSEARIKELDSRTGIPSTHSRCPAQHLFFFPTFSLFL